MKNRSVATMQERPPRLRIAREPWEQAVRRLELEPGQCAVGTVRWRVTPHTREALVDRLEVQMELPSGDERPPFDDWFVLAVQRGVPHAEGLLRRVRPSPSQNVVGLVLSAEDKSRWDGAALYNGRIQPLTGFRVCGGVSVDREPVALQANDSDESGRWSRTVGAIGRDVWAKVRASVVTLVGAGRTGSQLAFQFAAIGVSALRIVDPDVLETFNLDAMPGLTVADVGSPKAAALAARLIEFRPDLAISYAARSVLEPAGAELLRQPADLIATCVDSDSARLAAALVARRDTLAPHLDVGTAIVANETGGWSMTADVRLLLPGEGCAMCVGGLADREQTLYELAAPPGALKRGERREWFDQRAGSLSCLNSTAVGIAVAMWLDLLAGRNRDSRWSRLRWASGEGLNVDSASVGSAEDCPVCSIT